MAGEMTTGAFGGLLSGAGTGMTVGGPVGAAIGGGIGLLTGLASGSNAKRLEKGYQAAERAVNPEDAQQNAFLQRLRQQERNFRAGTDASSAFAAQQARGVNAQTQANIMRAGGGNTVGNLLRAQAGTNTAMARIGADAAASANQLMGMQSGLIGQIADRRYNRQRELRDQALFRSQEARQGINNMLAGGLAMIPQMTMGFGGMGGAKAAGQAGFDPFAATSQGVGTYYPGAYNAQDVTGAVTRMQPRMPQPTPLSYAPIG